MHSSMQAQVACKCNTLATIAAGRGNPLAQLSSSLLFICASGIVVKKLSEPHDAGVRDYNGRTLAVGALLGNLQVPASGISFQVEIKQLGLNL